MFKISLLEIRRHEKDFLLRNDNKYVQKLNDEIVHFKEMVAESGLEDAQKTLLLEKIEAYRKSFTVAAKEGKNTTGLGTEYRELSHDIEGYVNEHYVENRTADILMLRRHEKDYLLRLDTKYKERADKVIATIREHVNNSMISDADRKELLDDFKSITANDGWIKISSYNYCSNKQSLILLQSI